MELRDALRMLRSEIGLTQSELAAAVNVGFSAESRWENKNTRPNKASSVALLALAQKHRVSAACLDALTSLLFASRAKDKADKEKLRHVTEQMKLEERVLLTNEQMKATIDNLDLAVIVQRIRSASAEGIQVIYQNKRYAEIFGYTQEEFDRKSRENIYFCISSESRSDYLRLIKKLIQEKIPLSEFTMTLRAVKNGGAGIWLEIRGINLTRYSYGCELFLSCRDVTQRVEAERRYAEEVAVRDASLQNFFASFFCDLTANKVFRCRNHERVVGRRFAGETVDSVFDAFSSVIAEGPDRELFSRRFCRERLLKTYVQKDASGSAVFFNTVARRWLRCDYILIPNPYTEHLEAAVFLYDIQRQTLAERMMGVISDQFFEYIGLIDVALGSFEAYYASSDAFKLTVQGKRDYQAVCEEKLRFFVDNEDRDAQRTAVRLDTVKSKLARADFYSVMLRIRNCDGVTVTKKVTYTYLDETHTMIVIAQSDAKRLATFARLSGAELLNG